MPEKGVIICALFSTTCIHRLLERLLLSSLELTSLLALHLLLLLIKNKLFACLIVF